MTFRRKKKCVLQADASSNNNAASHYTTNKDCIHHICGYKWSHLKEGRKTDQAFKRQEMTKAMPMLDFRSILGNTFSVSFEIWQVPSVSKNISDLLRSHITDLKNTLVEQFEWSSLPGNQITELEPVVYLKSWFSFSTISNRNHIVSGPAVLCEWLWSDLRDCKR